MQPPPGARMQAYKDIGPVVVRHRGTVVQVHIIIIVAGEDNPIAVAQHSGNRFCQLQNHRFFHQPVPADDTIIGSSVPRIDDHRVPPVPTGSYPGINPAVHPGGHQEERRKADNDPAHIRFYVTSRHNRFFFNFP